MARVDPYKNYRFLLEIDDIVQANFSECSGLGSDVEVVEYREGGDPVSVRKLIGKVSYPDITLKWGITDSMELYEWHMSAVSGDLKRKNGSVILLDDLGEEKIRWNFFQAWASKYEAPSLDAKGSDVAVTSLTIVVERFEQVKP